MKIQWSVYRFNQLSPLQLYQLMQLRVDVFVVEQNCIYRELDDLDVLPDTLHILGSNDTGLVAYARAMAPIAGAAKPKGCVKIGRVVVSRASRGAGIARQMLLTLLSHVAKQWPDSSVFLSAQTAALAFYESLGFRAVSDEYLEDGIAHIDMLADEFDTNSGERSHA